MNSVKRMAFAFCSFVSLCQLNTQVAVAYDRDEESLSHRIINEPKFRVEHFKQCLLKGNVERVGMLLDYDSSLAKIFFKGYSLPIIAMKNDECHGRALELFNVLKKYGAEFDANTVYYAIELAPHGEKFIAPLLEYGADPLDSLVEFTLNQMFGRYQFYPYNSPILHSLKRIHQIFVKRKERREIENPLHAKL